MAEWSKAQHWKCCVGVTLPRVRIPVSPPLLFSNHFQSHMTFVYAKGMRTQGFESEARIADAGGKVTSGI